MNKPGQPKVIQLSMLKYAVIVDGDPAMLSMVANYLKNKNVESIQKFSSGDEALNAVTSSPCDILILDWKLKKPSGPEIYNTIRATPELAKLPILLISGSVTAADVQIAKSDPFTKFIVKPFAEEILLSYISKFVSSAKKTANSQNAVTRQTQNPLGSGSRANETQDPTVKIYSSSQAVPGDKGIQFIKSGTPGKQDRGLVVVSGNGQNGNLGLHIDKGNRIIANGTQITKNDQTGPGESATQTRDQGNGFTARQKHPDGTDMEFKKEGQKSTDGDFSIKQPGDSGGEFSINQERPDLGTSMDGKFKKEGLSGASEDGQFSENSDSGSASTSNERKFDGSSSGSEDDVKFKSGSDVKDIPPPSKSSMMLDDNSPYVPSGANVDPNSIGTENGKKILCTSNVLGTPLQIFVPVKTLVVDQDEAQQILITQYLNELGADNITCIGDSTSAWHAILCNYFELIVMDWKLRELGGLALYSRIRESPESSHLPVIVMSGFAHKGDFRILGESYYTNFLEKPIKKNRFETVLKETLTNAATHDKVTAMVSSLIEKMKGDQKRIIQLIEGMLKNIAKPLIFVVSAGQHLIEKGQLELAEKVLRIAQRLEGDNVTVITELSKIYHRTGRSDLAKTMLSKANVISPDSIERLCLMGEIGLTMQDPVTARKAFETALKIDKEHVKGNAGLVLVKGMSDTQIKPGENGTPASVKSVTLALASSLNAVAVSYVKNAEINKAIDQYQAAMCFIYDTPTLARLQFNLGMAYLRDKKLKEAHGWFKSASDIASDDFIKPKIIVQKLNKFYGIFDEFPTLPTEIHVQEFVAQNEMAEAETVTEMIKLDQEVQIIQESKDKAS